MSATHKLIALALAVLVVPTSLWAITGNNKKKKADPPSAAETWPRDGIQGFAVITKELGERESLRVEAGERQATLPNELINETDLVQVVGSQTEVTLYEQPNFRGHSLTLRCGNYELLQQPRNDIESFAVRYVRDARRCQGTPERPVQYRTWTR
jgi:hypothetical protein